MLHCAAAEHQPQCALRLQHSVDRSGPTPMCGDSVRAASVEPVKGVRSLHGRLRGSSAAHKCESLLGSRGVKRLPSRRRAGSLSAWRNKGIRGGQLRAWWCRQRRARSRITGPPKVSACHSVTVGTSPKWICSGRDCAAG